jgi:hypothetical protein
MIQSRPYHRESNPRSIYTNGSCHANHYTTEAVLHCLISFKIISMPRKLDFMHVTFVQLKYEWHIKITAVFANQKSDWIEAIYNQLIHQHMNILTKWFLFFIHETVIKTEERRPITNFRLCIVFSLHMLPF